MLLCLLLHNKLLLLLVLLLLFLYWVEGLRLLLEREHLRFRVLRMCYRDAGG